MHLGAIAHAFALGALPQTPHCRGLPLGLKPIHNGHQSIKDASFQAKKTGLKAWLQVATPMPSSLAVASQRISRLNATVDGLKEENARLRDSLVMWQYNAYKRRLSQAQLEEPLPIVDRERNET